LSFCFSARSRRTLSRDRPPDCVADLHDDLHHLPLLDVDHHPCHPRPNHLRSNRRRHRRQQLGLIRQHEHRRIFSIVGNYSCCGCRDRQLGVLVRLAYRLHLLLDRRQQLEEGVLQAGTSASDGSLPSANVRLLKKWEKKIF
jgi:hypothetical protein